MKNFWWENDANLTPRYHTLKRQVHEFARKHVRPAALALDSSDPKAMLPAGSPLRELLAKAYERGWHSSLIPPGLGGGLGFRGLDLHGLFEELGWGSADVAMSLLMTGLPFSFLAATGGKEMIADVVKPFTTDRDARMIGCWAVSESAHGSDQFLIGADEHLALTAELRGYLYGDEIVINGAKSPWIVNAAIATHLVTSLILISERNVAEHAIAFIPLDLPGVSRGDPVAMLGQRSLGQAALRFDSVRVPRRHVLIERAEYEVEFKRTLTFVFAAMSSIFTGVARAAYEIALDYANTREQGGRKLSEHQLVQKRLFEMYARVESSQALSRSAMLYDVAGPVLERAVAAKVFATRAALAVSDSALMLSGAQALQSSHLLGKLYRDARVSLMECGSNDVLALLAGKTFVLEEV